MSESQQLAENIEPLYKVEPPVESTKEFSVEAYINWLKQLAAAEGKEVPRDVQKMEETLKYRNPFKNVLALLKGETDLWLSRSLSQLNSSQRNAHENEQNGSNFVLEMLKDDVNVEGIQAAIKNRMFAIANSIVA